jgi:hypothetical protein
MWAGEREGHHRSGKYIVGGKDLAAWCERPLRVHEGSRTLAASHCVEDDVVAFWPTREVLGRAVDDGARAE